MNNCVLNLSATVIATAQFSLQYRRFYALYLRLVITARFVFKLAGGDGKGGKHSYSPILTSFHLCQLDQRYYRKPTLKNTEKPFGQMFDF